MHIGSMKAKRRVMLTGVNSMTILIQTNLRKDRKKPSQTLILPPIKMNGRNYSSDSRCQSSTEKSSQMLTEAALVLGHHSLNLHLYLPKRVLYLPLDMWTLQVHFTDCSMLSCYFSSLPCNLNLKFTLLQVCQ